MRFQLDNALLQLFANRAQRAIQLVRRCHELFGGIERDHAQRFVRVTGQRVKTRDRFDFVAEELKPNAFFISASWVNLDHIAPHAKPSAGEGYVIAFIKHVDQPTENGLARWSDRWTLDRVRVNNGDGVAGLAAHLRSLGLPS